MDRILYIASLIPSHSGSGGKRAAYNHLKDLQQSGAQVTTIAVNIEEEKLGSEVFNEFNGIKIFDRGLPKFKHGMLAKCLALCQLICDPRPRAVASACSKAAAIYIAELLDAHKWDFIILEHLNSFGIIGGNRPPSPIIYIAQNVESKVVYDKVAWEKGLSLKIINLIEYFKTRRFERNSIRRSSKVVAISSIDCEQIKKIKNDNKTVKILTELSEPSKNRWKGSQGNRKLLFVGSAQYFPNREAIDWLVMHLMPEIDKIDNRIILQIVGASVNDRPTCSSTGNVQYLGFVSHSELERLHVESDLFLCPIKLGSGIKMKLVGAAACGLPIIATQESLAGLEFLSGLISAPNNREAKYWADIIFNLLNDADKLTEMSLALSKGYHYALEARGSLSDILKGS